MQHNGSRHSHNHDTTPKLHCLLTSLSICSVGMMGKCLWHMQTERMVEHTCHVHEGQGKEKGFARGLRVRGEDGNAGQELVENLQASRYTSVRRQRLANVVLVQRQENGNVRLKREWSTIILRAAGGGKKVCAKPMYGLFVKLTLKST